MFSRIRTFLLRIKQPYCTNKSTDKNGSNLEIPPEPTNCCMSGCPNCVWIEYAETLSKLFHDGGSKAKQIILDKVSDPNMRAYLQTELKMLERMKETQKDQQNTGNSKEPPPEPK
ncbi:oxidoreductase-like domain-containing protein 1 [Hermetia illucens]|nr:oxidoreductase-like domain-containing protein 1 [Hermetia illucens]